MKSWLISLFTLLTFSTAYANTNIRLSPLSPLAGVIDVEVDFKISEAWSFGPQMSILSTDDGNYDVTGYKLGARANYFFNGSVFTQGWYFGPSVSIISVNVKENLATSNYEGDATGIGFVGMFGYQWMWESFNINLGGGPSFVSVNEITIKDNAGNKKKYDGFSGAGLAIEFMLGWKF